MQDYARKAHLEPDPDSDIDAYTNPHRDAYAVRDPDSCPDSVADPVSDSDAETGRRLCSCVLAAALFKSSHISIEHHLK